jgi:TPP-dependent pyruvate/acetoin dehydrogenase alpha subunit
MPVGPAPRASFATSGLVAPAGGSELADAVVLYRHLVTLRLLSARMVDLQRSERVAFHAASLGEEGVIAGAALAAREGDWVFSGAREWGATLVRGLPVLDFAHHAFGSQRDPAKGHAPPDHAPARRLRVVSASGLPGAHVLQAVGAAWAARIQRHDVATVALFDAASLDSGDLHNALNFAGVFRAPCVLVGRTGGAERSVPVAERAAAYGLASASVDGGDALAVLAVVRAALARAARGDGATLVEATTTPLAPELPPPVWQHGSSELLTLGPSDPLERLRRVLAREGLLDGAADEALATEARACIAAAVAAAAAEPPPAPSTLFDDVYAQVPPHLRAQKEASPWRR